jgi:hypothetical protein
LGVFLFATRDTSTRNTSAHNATPVVHHDAAVLADLNKWWQEATYAPAPEKPGTITRFRAAKHVQSQQEYRDQLEDARWSQHWRSVVIGFSVAGEKVTAKTTLTQNPPFDLRATDHRDAQELCRWLRGFVWNKRYRHWGLKDISVTGAKGELLSYSYVNTLPALR